MADTLVRRVLAPHLAEDGPAELPLVINVVVPDTVLLGDDDGTAWVEEYGDVPGHLLREWIAAHAEQGILEWVTRLYRTPSTGQLVAMEQGGRVFGGKLAQFLKLSLDPPISACCAPPFGALAALPALGRRPVCRSRRGLAIAPDW